MTSLIDYLVCILFWLILYLEKKWGIQYSIGGTGQIIKGLETLMTEEGVKIIKSSEVVSLINKKNKIIGVKLQDGSKLESDYVICNSDPPGVYSRMIKEKSKNQFFKWKMNRMQYSMGLFVYYFGTKIKYENIEHHTIKFGNKYKEHLNDIFEKKILNSDISYYLHRPTATDESMAPNGNDCFYVLVPVPNNKSNINWEIASFKRKYNIRFLFNARLF